MKGKVMVEVVKLFEFEVPSRSSLFACSLGALF